MLELAHILFLVRWALSLGSEVFGDVAPAFTLYASLSAALWSMLHGLMLAAALAIPLSALMAMCGAKR